MMPYNKNVVIIACAGSGKTSRIVDEALKIKNEKVLITTYTNENIDQINEYILKTNGYIPSNIIIQSWFSFLLHEGVRPYQNHMNDNERVRSIFFQTKQTRGHKKDKYLTSLNYIYSNKVAEFVFECNKKTEGLVAKRLNKIYKYIFIDELQDFAGYDLNVLEMFCNSDIRIKALGDPRQATFSTNNAQKNKQYRRSNIFMWLKEKEQDKLISIEEYNISYRCNQLICDFADALFPAMPKTISKNTSLTEHDGIFEISRGQVREYMDTYEPKLLKYNKKTNTQGIPAANIGISKGRTYDRILLFPTKTMLEYLKTKDLSKFKDKNILYVAVTRARHSVAFVKD